MGSADQDTHARPDSGRALEAQMKVYHVWQVVKPGAFCSCIVGNHWVKSCDTEAEAAKTAEKYNQHRFCVDGGIEYVVTGPQEEAEQARF